MIRARKGWSLLDVTRGRHPPNDPAIFMRALLRLTTALLFLAPILFAQTPALTSPPVPATTHSVLWPDGQMPGTVTKEAEREMPARGDGFHRITNTSRPTLEIFTALKKVEPAPAVIVCPGGGYSYVVYDKEGTEIATWLSTQGITALVLKY